MVSYDENNRQAVRREQMVRLDLRGRDITDRRVLQVMSELPRETFVKSDYADQAYEDNPLPIGLGQTISQPYIVALMTQALDLEGDEIVLEIGTGSGYQTAVLAGLCRRVYTVERFSDLSIRAQTALGNLGIENVEYAAADGSTGWPDPDKQFDRIIVTAAVPSVPDPLVAQLKDRGIIVAPIGEGWHQTLTKIEKVGTSLRETPLTGCRFVKLIGQYGFGE